MDHPQRGFRAGCRKWSATGNVAWLVTEEQRSLRGVGIIRTLRGERTSVGREGIFDGSGGIRTAVASVGICDGIGIVRIVAQLPEIRAVLRNDLRSIGCVGIAGTGWGKRAAELAIRIVDALG